MGILQRPASSLRGLRLRHLFQIPDFSTGVADFDHPKISVNARLFDAFDLDQVEVVVLDGKNLW